MPIRYARWKLNNIAAATFVAYSFQDHQNPAVPAMPATEPKYELSRVLMGAQLPALPQSAIRLLELARNPDNGPREFAVPIEADPGLTGQVLKFVNSSYF